MAEDCIGEAVEAQAQSLKAGQVLLLENVRFYKEETKNDPGSLPSWRRWGTSSSMMHSVQHIEHMLPQRV